MWVHDLRDADASCGGKAVGLAKLIVAGLDVPGGFVISDGAFRALVGDLAIGDTGDIGQLLGRVAEHIATAPIPAELEREVRERTRELGAFLAVRSSATIEDGAAGAAAGVFSSRTAVAADDVWPAIRAVWTSALTPLAAAYARRRGGEIAIGVIVQSYIAGTPIVVYTRAPGSPDGPELLVQHADVVSRHSRDDLPREISSQHAALIALRAEQALACPTGVDVELVQLRKQSGFDDAIETVIVQARPIVHPVPRTLTPPPPAVLSTLLDGRIWHWDVAHNPDPLSTAQQGLVERVETAGLAPYSMRLCGGFLYSASRGEPAPIAPATAAELSTRAVELEARLGATLQSPTRAAAANQEVARDWTPSVAEAIERYLAFYAIWARELSPLIRAARTVLPATLRRRGVSQPEQLAAQLVGPRESAVEACLFAAARGEIEESDVERHLGCLSPAWDVSVPTYAERPGVIRDAIARARRALEVVRPDDANAARDRRAAASGMSTAIERALVEEIAIAREAADLAERDDSLFARAQWLVRRALLARARASGLDPDDVFWLPIDELASAAPIDLVDARRRAAGARAAAQRAARWRMPVVVGGEDLGVAAEGGATLRGVGSGPRAAGRVVRFASLASAVAVGSGDVVVARAITPALAVLVAGCAAIVSETGGYLDHGAALARELGIPCVVGCRDAWSVLTDGMVVTVDGDAGTVTRT